MVTASGWIESLGDANVEGAWLPAPAVGATVAFTTVYDIGPVLADSNGDGGFYDAWRDCATPGSCSVPDGYVSPLTPVSYDTPADVLTPGGHSLRDALLAVAGVAALLGVVLLGLRRGWVLMRRVSG